MPEARRTTPCHYAHPANLPEYDGHKAALTEAFVTHMGGAIIDASRLRWSHCEPDTDQPELKYRGKIDDNPAG